jgi:hypothetical protein
MNQESEPDLPDLDYSENASKAFFIAEEEEDLPPPPEPTESMKLEDDFIIREIDEQVEDDSGDEVIPPPPRPTESMMIAGGFKKNKFKEPLSLESSMKSYGADLDDEESDESHLRAQSPAVSSESANSRIDTKADVLERFLRDDVTSSNESKNEEQLSRHKLFPDPSEESRKKFSSVLHFRDISKEVRDSYTPDKDRLIKTIVLRDLEEYSSSSESPLNFFKKKKQLSSPSQNQLTSPSSKVPKDRISKCIIAVERAGNLFSAPDSETDVIVQVALYGAQAKYDLFRTSPQKGSNPIWRERKKFQIDIGASWYIHFRVLTKKLTANEFLGEIFIPIAALSNGSLSRSFHLLGKYLEADKNISTPKSGDLPSEDSPVAVGRNITFTSQDLTAKLHITIQTEGPLSYISSSHKVFYQLIKNPCYQYPVFDEEQSKSNSSKCFYIPGAAEKCEVFFPEFLISHLNRTFIGDLYLTNFRVVFFAKKQINQHSVTDDLEDEEEDEKEEYSTFRVISEYSFAFTYSNIFEVYDSVSKDTKTPKAFSYLKKNVSKSDIQGMTIVLEDFREISLLFSNLYAQNAKNLTKVIKKILKHKRVPNRAFPLCMQIVHELRSIYPEKKQLFDLLSVNSKFSMKEEMRLQNLPANQFEFCKLNIDYTLCSSYPSELYFPSKVTEKHIQESANFRGKNRLPALTYYSEKFGCCMARSAQPHTGFTSKHREADELLISSFRGISIKENAEYLIFDARSEIAAEGNKLKGMGFENITRYEKAKILFMGIANIHTMRASIDKLRSIVTSSGDNSSENSWLSLLESSKWFIHLRSILLASTQIAKIMSKKGTSILVHCSDGWDRTAQLCSLTQILLDARFRTCTGLRNVIEKDFLSFGHKFNDRLGDHTLADQRSPVFLQFLDCVYQLTKQFPFAFEFTSSYLVALGEHCKSGWFGTFSFNTEMERNNQKLADHSFSIWSYLDMLAILHPSKYVNPHFDPEFDDVLFPISSVRRLELWSDFYLRHDYTAYETIENFESSVLVTKDFNASINSAQELSHILWAPEEIQTHCMECKAEFSIVKRKHRCKVCGGLFCHQCLGQRLVIREYGDRPQKVCNACYTFSQNLEERIRMSVSRRRSELQTLKNSSMKKNI